MAKQVKVKALPREEKRPRTATNPDDFYKRNPSWRIAKMEWVDPYGWHALDGEGLQYVYERLCCFECMTWHEILCVGKRQNHLVDVEGLSKVAQQRLEDIGQGDLEQLLSLRLSGTERVWGILETGTVTLLWWDPEHQVCPSLLRNS